MLNAQGVEAFSNTEIFSSTAYMLNYVQPNEEEVIPQRATRNATRENPTEFSVPASRFSIEWGNRGSQEASPWRVQIYR